MEPPSRVLIDTSAFLAIQSTSDEFHQHAMSIYERLVDRSPELWTTSYALVETIALVQRRLGFATLKKLLDSLEGVLNIFWIDSAVHAESVKRLIAHEGRGFSLVDWTLVLASNELNAHVFTFDRRFEEQGIAVVGR